MSNLKKFDLEKVLAGEKFISKSQAIEILDYKWWGICGEFHVYHASNDNGLDDGFLIYDRNGKLLQNKGDSCPVDLYMAPTKNKGWINIYKYGTGEEYDIDGIYENKEEGLEVSKYYTNRKELIKLIQIEIEWED